MAKGRDIRNERARKKNQSKKHQALPPLCRRETTTKREGEAEEDSRLTSRSNFAGEVGKPRWLKRWPLGIVGALGTLASLLSGFLVLKPDVAIASPRYLNDSDPFSARFDIANHNSIIAMKDVQISCALNRVKSAANIDFDNSVVLDHHYDSISPSETDTIACPLTTLFALKNFTSADITVFVNYKWLLSPSKLNARQVFVAERDVNGSLRWSARPFSSPLE